METTRPIVLSIAGLDPCGGAGLLADIKTFEQHKVYGLGICSAQTVQNENEFFDIRWEDTDAIIYAIEKMLLCYEVKTVKIGIVKNIAVLNKIVSFIHQKNKSIKIVIDTIFKSSSGFDFWEEAMNEDFLFEIFSKAFLITPNFNEAIQLVKNSDAKEAAIKLSTYCNVLLKGGHNSEESGVDYLFTKNDVEKLLPTATKKITAKHGSGCVLSAAIVSNLALGFDLPISCLNAKKYIEQFLSSNESLLGYHYA